MNANEFAIHFVEDLTDNVELGQQAPEIIKAECPSNAIQEFLRKYPRQANGFERFIVINYQSQLWLYEVETKLPEEPQTKMIIRSAYTTTYIVTA